MYASQIILSTLNVKNIKGNYATIEEELAKSDIIFLQEHWLFNFQTTNDEVIENLSHWKHFSKAVDDIDHIEPTHKPRGHGGISILYKEWLAPNITQCEDGNERIQVITISDDSMHLCLINVYLPSGTNKEALDDYIMDMGILEGILLKYQNHIIIIGGDFNCDLLNRSTVKESLWKMIIEGMNFHVHNIQIKDQHTFCSIIDGTTSHLDYILCNDESMINSIEIPVLYLNNSDHKAVTCNILIDKQALPKQHKCKVIEQIQWSKGDPTLYKEIVDQNIDNIEFDLLPYDTAIRVFSMCLSSAQLMAFETRKKKCCQKKRKFPMELMEAIKSSKNAYKVWRDMGKPGDDHPTTIKKHTANKHVKYLQKHLSLNKDENLYSRIMDSYKDDNKIFHTLINRQNNDNNNKIKALRIDGKISYDEEKQRNSWADYYEELATPKDIDNDAVPVNFLRQFFLDEVYNKQIDVSCDMVESAIKNEKEQSS